MMRPRFIRGPYLLTWGIGLLLAALAAMLAVRAIGPAPPDTLRIAVGTGTGPDAEMVRRWRLPLAERGLGVVPVTTDGSLDALERLRAGQLDLAIVAGAADPGRDATDVVALGSIAREGVFIFVRRDAGTATIAQLRGRRIAAGRPVSGTHRLTMALLGLHGIGPGDVRLLETGGDGAADALLAGQADAAVIVSPIATGAIERLMADPAVALLDVSPRAAAYALALPALSPAVLPAGTISLAQDLPRQQATLLTASAVLVARADVHPASVRAMMGVLEQAQGGRTLFAPAGTFPQADGTATPLHGVAHAWYQRGPDPLFAWLPHRWAAGIERFWVLLLPIGILLSVLRLAPAVHGWLLARRLWRVAAAMPSLEDAVARGQPEAAARLRRLEAELAGMPPAPAILRDLIALRRQAAELRRLAERLDAASAHG